MAKIGYCFGFFLCSLLLKPTFGSSESCPASRIAFPEHFSTLTDQSGSQLRYPFTEPSFQIFTHMEIPCTGHILEFRFLSAKTLIRGLHFGVFKLVDNTAQFIADVHISELKLEQQDTWASYRPSGPIRVEYGMVLGMFYDNIEDGSASVRSLTLSDDEDASFDTYVFMKTANQLPPAGQGFVALSEGHLAKRLPAFYVVLEGNKLDPVPVFNGPAPLKGACQDKPPNALSAAIFCPGQVVLGYYYHARTKFCREFLYCRDKNANLDQLIGFASYKECVESCA